jgi:hypothetical protein
LITIFIPSFFPAVGCNYFVPGSCLYPFGSLFAAHDFVVMISAVLSTCLFKYPWHPILSAFLWIPDFVGRLYIEGSAYDGRTFADNYFIPQ